MKRISTQQYASAILSAVNEKDADIQNVAKNCIKLLVRERNIRRIPEIVKALDELYAQKGLRFQIELRTTSKCTPSEIQAWHTKLEKTLKAPVELKVVQDTKLLGGAIIKIHNTVYDGSMKSTITQLQLQLLRSA
jgi:ATP synthase F1 delta subunit